VEPNQHPKPGEVTELSKSLVEIIEEFGAGEGIRTLDPNLGKVVLYP
jgi:hypothetical protein